MAWERSFEARVLKIRDRELKYQKLNYTIEASNLIRTGASSDLLSLFRHCGTPSGLCSFREGNAKLLTPSNAFRNGSPILVTLVAFWHFAVYRGEVLTPSIAFTSISGMPMSRYVDTHIMSFT